MVIVDAEGFTKVQCRNKVVQDCNNMREAARTHSSLRAAQIKLTPSMPAATSIGPNRVGATNIGGSHSSSLLLPGKTSWAGTCKGN